MKKATLVNLIIFIIAFIEVVFIVLMPYCDLFKYFRLEGASFWAIILILNGFILSFLLLNGFKSKTKPSSILLWTIIGSMIFILPFSLARFPLTILGISYSFNLLVGIVSAYFVFKSKTLSKRLIIIGITVLYAIIHFLFIAPNL